MNYYIWIIFITSIALAVSLTWHLTKKISYQEGKRDGAEEELKKFIVRYTAFTDETGNVVNKKIRIGYDMQLYYQNFPVGDPTRRIIREEKRLNEDVVNAVIETLKALPQNNITKNFTVDIVTAALSKAVKRR